MIKNIRIEGLDSLESKLNADVLMQPEIDAALGKFADRVTGRTGKGLGAKRNSLTPHIEPLSAEIESTLNYPRTTGTSWTRKNEGAIRGMSGRVVKKAIAGIEARWAER